MHFTFPIITVQKELHPRDIPQTLAELNSSEGVEKIDLLNSLALYFVDKDLKASLEYTESSMKLSEELGDNARLGLSTLLRGRGYFNSNEILSALEYFTNALTIFEKLGDKEKISEALVRTGRCQNLSGDNTRSLETLFKAIKYCRETGNLRRESEALIEISVAYLANRDYELSLDYLTSAQEICLKALGQKELASVFGSMGNVYVSIPDYEKAYEYFKRCLMIFEDIKFQQSIGATYHNLGITLCGMKRFDEALDYTEKSLAISEELNKKESSFRILGTLGTIYNQKKEYDKSLEYFFKAFELADKYNFKHGIENMYRETSEVYELKGDFENAHKFMNKLYNTSMNRLENFSKFNAQYLSVAHKVDTLKHESESLGEKNLELNELNSELNLKNTNLSDALNTLRTQSEEIERINDVNTRILSILAHDLKNPLGALQQVTAMYIEKMINPEDIEDIFRELQSNATAALNMLNEVLQWGNTQVEKKKTAEFIDVNIYDLVRKKEEDYSLLLKTKNNKLINICEENFTFKADINMMRFILRNLIMNSNKFTANGNITVSAFDIGDQIQVTVNDTGVGMKPSQMSRLFQWDTRQSSEGTSGEKGTGLGLLICNEFVQNHKGKIWVESVLGKGSSFHFTVSKSL